MKRKFLQDVAVLVIIHCFVIWTRMKPLEKREFSGRIAKVLDRQLKVNQFKLQSLYCIHFQTHTLGNSLTPHLIPPSYGFSSITAVFFYKYGFYLYKFEVKQNQTNPIQTLEKKAAKELYKNVMCCFEEILEAVPCKRTDVSLFSSNFTNPSTTKSKIYRALLGK